MSGRAALKRSQVPPDTAQAAERASGLSGHPDGRQRRYEERSAGKVDAAAVARFVRILTPALSEPLTLAETVILYSRIVDLSPPAEIARRLHYSVATVRTHLWQARVKLRHRGLHAWEPLLAQWWYAAGIADGVRSATQRAT